MRIISGTLRGRKLVAPMNDKVRPTADAVKEAVFNIIAGYIDEDTIVYDLFAGTGSLGIEAISRGVKKVYFSDASRESIAIIKENIALLQLENQCSVMAYEYAIALSKIQEKADLVFIDPPYELKLSVACSQALIEMDKLNEDALIVIEHDTRDILEGFHEAFHMIKHRTYGKKSITILKYGSEE